MYTNRIQRQSLKLSKTGLYSLDVPVPFTRKLCLSVASTWDGVSKAVGPIGCLIWTVKHNTLRHAQGEQNSGWTQISSKQHSPREEDRETFRRYLRKVQSKNFISSKLFHNYKGYGKTLWTHTLCWGETPWTRKSLGSRVLNPPNLGQLRRDVRKH